MNRAEGGLARREAGSLASSGPSLWREIARTYGFPFIMFALAIVPGMNFTYSGHGGIAWFFIPLCFPYIVVRGIIKLVAARGGSFAWYARFFALTIPSYVVLAYPLSWAATTSLQRTFGLEVPCSSFWAIMISPVPYWYLS